MGQVTPPGPPAPNAGADVGGMVLGIVLGLIGSVVASVILVFGPMMILSANTTARGSDCGSGILIGTLALAGSVLLAAFAWYMVFRNRTRSFVAGLVRGLAVVLALFFLIPWPCSSTWLVAVGYSACLHH